MSNIAKSYITLVIASGMALLLLAAGSWSSANWKQFAVYLGLAALASALKVRIPGMEGTISPNFVFLLLGMVALPFRRFLLLAWLPRSCNLSGPALSVRASRKWRSAPPRS